MAIPRLDLDVEGWMRRSVGDAVLEGAGMGGLREGTGVKNEEMLMRGAVTSRGAFKPKELIVRSEPPTVLSSSTYTWDAGAN